MASIFDKVMGLLGVRDEDETLPINDSEYDEEREPEYEEPITPIRTKQERDNSRKSNLVSLAGAAKQTRVIIVEPDEFEKVRSLVDHLKNKSPVIVRLAHLDRNEAKRIVDFMSGATYALNGNMRKLGDTIFFFAPQSIVIEGELETTLFDLKENE